MLAPHLHHDNTYRVPPINLDVLRHNAAVAYVESIARCVERDRIGAMTVTPHTVEMYIAACRAAKNAVARHEVHRGRLIRAFANVEVPTIEDMDVNPGTHE